MKSTAAAADVAELPGIWRIEKEEEGAQREDVEKKASLSQENSLLFSTLRMRTVLLLPQSHVI